MMRTWSPPSFLLVLTVKTVTYYSSPLLMSTFKIKQEEIEICKMEAASQPGRVCRNDRACPTCHLFAS